MFYFPAKKELVIFVSNDCNNCHRLIVELEKKGIEPDKVIYLDDEPKYMIKYAIRSVPTTIYFVDDVPERQWTGYSKKIVNQIVKKCVMIAIYNLEPKYINIALEKVRLYYQRQNKKVTDYLPLWHSTYDKVYCSSIFTYTNKSQVNPDMK